MGTSAIMEINLNQNTILDRQVKIGTLSEYIFQGSRKKSCQLISSSSVRVLKITGKTTLEDKTQLDFEKKFIVSEDCDTNKITARFERGILCVMNVKPIKQHKQIPPPKTPKDSPDTETDQEQAATQKTTRVKPVQKKEAKSAKDESKADAPEGTKKDKREKNSNIRDDEQNADDNMYQKRDADQSANKGTNYDNAKLKAGTLAYKLKMDRQKMSMLLAFLFSFALAMCISNLKACFLKKKYEKRKLIFVIIFC
ncbi:hypothetical protein OROGR_019634 [Orobanche gracilis]